MIIWYKLFSKKHKNDQRRILYGEKGEAGLTTLLLGDFPPKVPIILLIKLKAVYSSSYLVFLLFGETFGLNATALTKSSTNLSLS